MGEGPKAEGQGRRRVRPSVAPFPLAQLCRARPSRRMQRPRCLQNGIPMPQRRVANVALPDLSLPEILDAAAPGGERCAVSLKAGALPLAMLQPSADDLTMALGR